MESCNLTASKWRERTSSKYINNNNKITIYLIWLFEIINILLNWYWNTLVNDTMYNSRN